MRNFWLLIFSFFLLLPYGQAQTIPGRIHVGTKDYSGSCPANGLIYYNVLDGKEFNCTNGTWVSSTGVPPQTMAAFQFSGVPTMSCTVGDMGFQTDATAGSNLWLCTSANTWTQHTGGGGGTGTPGGATTAVQYNSSGTLGGDAANFSYNSTTHQVTVTGGLSSGGTTAGLVQLGQGNSNTCGSNAICLEAPTSVPTSTEYVYPSAIPTAGQVFSWSAPVSGVSTGSLITPLQAGTVSGTAGTPFCTDANGKATTVGCTAGSGPMFGTGAGLGTWCPDGCNSTVASGLGIGAGNVYYYPITVPASITVNSISIKVSQAATSTCGTGTATCGFTMGVYQAGSTLSSPSGSLVFSVTGNTGGTNDISTTGYKTFAVSGSPTLKAGTYIFAWALEGGSLQVIDQGGNFSADTYYNSTYRCTSTPTGTGATFALPSTCTTPVQTVGLYIPMVAFRE